MARQSSGFEGEAPTMVQMFTPAKGARGGRVGRAPGFGDVMTQYGYGTPGANITVSPTFSNIGNPNVNVTGPSMGDVTIRGGGGGGGNNRPGNNQPGNNRPGNNQPGNNQPGNNRPGNNRPGNNRPGSGPGNDGGRDGGRSGGGGGGLGLKDAVNTGQEKNPRVTKSELKDILAGKGPKGVENVAERIRNNKTVLGNKARELLEKQLETARRDRGGNNRKSSENILRKNLSTGGGIGRPTDQRTSGERRNQDNSNRSAQETRTSAVNRARTRNNQAQSEVNNRRAQREREERQAQREREERRAQREREERQAQREREERQRNNNRGGRRNR